MGQRLIYQLDLLDLKRRRRYEGAARRNGKRLSVWLREVADAAAERRPEEWEGPPHPVREALAGIDVEAIMRYEDREPHVHSPKVLPWGGRQCEGCGDLL